MVVGETGNFRVHPTTWRYTPFFQLKNQLEFCQSCNQLRCQASARRKRLKTPSWGFCRRKGLFQTLGRLGKKSSAYLRELTGWIQDITHYCIYMFLWLEMCIYASVEKQVSYVYCLLLIIPNKSHAMISLFWSSNSWMHETCFRIISKQLQNGSDVHFGSECITNITKLLFSEWCSKSRLTCLAMAHAQRIDL